MEMDFNILWVSKCEYPAKHVVKINHHDYYQLIFVLNGDGNISLGESEYRAKINQLYLVKPNVNHGISASAVKYLSTVEFKFYCSNDSTDYMLRMLPSYIENAGFSVRNLLLNVVEEVKRQDSHHEEMIKLHLIQLIYYLSRSFKSESMSREILSDRNEFDELDLEKYKPLKTVINYIKENYSKEIALNDLAEMIHLNSVYFCSIFKENYGVTPMNYLQNVRLENAKTMLINLDETITDIAFKVGFQSVHYFSRFFKHHEGMSPVEFRRRNTGYICKDFNGNITDFS